MTKLFIPACGDRLTLAKPWSFTLYLEHRNVKFGQSVGLVARDVKWSQWEDVEDGRGQLKKVDASLPSGTVLEGGRLGEGPGDRRRRRVVQEPQDRPVQGLRRVVRRRQRGVTEIAAPGP